MVKSRLGGSCPFLCFKNQMLRNNIIGTAITNKIITTGTIAIITIATIDNPGFVHGSRSPAVKKQSG